MKLLRPPPIGAASYKAATDWLKENGADWLEMSDAAAESYICGAKRLSINEVVKGGTSVAEEKERSFKRSL